MRAHAVCLVFLLGIICPLPDPLAPSVVYAEGPIIEPTRAGGRASCAPKTGGKGGPTRVRWETCGFSAIADIETGSVNVSRRADC